MIELDAILARATLRRSRLAGEQSLQRRASHGRRAAGRGHVGERRAQLRHLIQAEV